MVKCRFKWIITIFLFAWAGTITYFIYYSSASEKVNDFIKKQNNAALLHHVKDIRSPFDERAEVGGTDAVSEISLPNAIVYAKPAVTVNYKEFDHEGYLKKGLLKAGEDRYAANKFNQAASDVIAWNRSVSDSRELKCRSVVYDEKSYAHLRTSIIITYHNEARSTLLRTVMSAFLRSPPELLLEIILVDDFSRDVDVGQQLTSIDKVRVIRNTRRDGLIRSRIKGARLAQAPVLTFLDSHCECNVDWLQPLLERIQQNPRAVLAPVIDVINMDTFNYVAASADLRGGFDWNLVFKWEFLTGTLRDERHQHPTAPIKTPVMAGGLFMIRKDWFETLGTYDPEMDVWGGENLGAFSIEYIGSIEHYSRLQLKQQLHCKNFTWFLKEVYPELNVPEREDGQYLTFKQTGLCIDSLGKQNVRSPVGVYSCHGTGGNQEWVFDKSKGTLKNPFTKLCLSDSEIGVVSQQKCDAVDGKWVLDEAEGRMQYKDLCVALIKRTPENMQKDENVLMLMPCDGSDRRQRWIFEKSNFS
ncbi:unnamed protein product [Anisakis simplex]|uniref:Polypeptide N-acetylgalactosaminyltransferase n=1 Tax=Anisakis simplex TaxID=6269 RepID=A0A0M3KAG4_ANISI|nr:unnamed protein product [Anisakis simplex]